MGIANDLERLAELHGAISDAEFARAKARASTRRRRRRRTP